MVIDYDNKRLVLMQNDQISLFEYFLVKHLGFDVILEEENLSESYRCRQPSETDKSP